MSFFRLFLLHLPLLIQLTSSVTIVCSTKRYTMWLSEKYRKCTVRNTISVSHRNISVHQVKISDEDDFDVKYVDIIAIMLQTADVSYMPVGLDEYFPDLDFLEVSSCGLREIKQHNLKGFPKLKNLFMSGNVIEYLEKDLFKYNLLLEMINFSQNLIKSIDANLFDELKELKLLNLVMNACISGESVTTDIKYVILKVREKCSGKRRNEELPVKRDQKRYSKNVWYLIGCAGVAVMIVVLYVIYRFCLTEKIEN